MYEMRTRSTTVDGRVVWMRLRSQKLLRRAMDETRPRAAADAAAGVPAGQAQRDCSSIPKLAQAIDRSTAAVGFLLSTGTSHRPTCTVETARRIAEAVRWDIDELFVDESSTPRSDPAYAASVPTAVPA